MEMISCHEVQDVEDLVLESPRGTGIPQARSRVMQRSRKSGGQPAFCGRHHERRPAGAAVDPGDQLVDEARLPQELMAAVADFECAIAGQRGSRLDQLRRDRAAYRNGRIGRRAQMGRRNAGRCRARSGRAGSADRPGDRTCCGCAPRSIRPPRACEEVLRQRVILRRAGSSEVIEGQAEAAVDVGLNGVLGIAEGPDVLAGLDGAELGGCAVLVGRADEEHVVADLPAEAGVDIGRQERACARLPEIASTPFT